MIHFIRNENNDTIVDVDATEDDIHVVVLILGYTRLLLDRFVTTSRLVTPRARHSQTELVNDFASLQELRAEYFETNYDKETTDELAERRLREIAEKYGLGYVTD